MEVTIINKSCRSGHPTIIYGTFMIRNNTLSNENVTCTQLYCNRIRAFLAFYISKNRIKKIIFK